MLTEIYIEALLVDEELADQVWEAWDAGEIDDRTVWWLIVTDREAVYDTNWYRPGPSLHL